MQRNVDRRADVARRVLAVEGNRPRNAGGLAEAAAGEKAADPSDDMAERDAGANVSDTDQSGMRCRHMYQNATSDRHDQPAVEHASRSHQRHQFGRVLIGVPFDDEQQQLGADERAHDDPDAEVHHPVGIEAARSGAHRARTAARADTQRPAGRRRCRPGTRGLQTEWDAWCRPRPIMSSRTRIAPMLIAASATLNAQKCASPQ